MQEKPSVNALIHESSPYLLQHANNPVQWHAWNEQTLQKAVDENMPLLISIGYAACHWCHVMAHESFEDAHTAQIMNENFFCIKLDREERPDVDSIYMRAAQMMTGGGGWPLHIFALPDGRPFYGGTYFPKQQWQNVLLSVANEYRQNRQKVIAFAEQLENGMHTNMIFKPVIKNNVFSKDEIAVSVAQLKSVFDNQNGGAEGAPKFPMPSLYNFLLNYGTLSQDTDILAQVELTLQKMAMGGIYDHVGGGFARYSTDPIWKVPHFEKMLYDNAQLLTLYSRSFRHFNQLLFRQIVEETAEFMLRELRNTDGLFTSSLDADSEGEEGKFYVWEINELKEVLGDLFATAKEIYNINSHGAWEKGKYILHKLKSTRELSELLNKEEGEILSITKKIRSALFEKRKSRTRPGLDHKCLTSWNGLAVIGLAEAYETLRDPDLLRSAEQTADFILSKLRTPDRGLFHAYTDGQVHIPGFLEDYSGMIAGLITLYQTTFNEERLHQAVELLEYVFENFYNKASGMFFFTSSKQKDLISRDVDIRDGVIPSTNSSLASSLLFLSRYFEKPEWENISIQMLNNMKNSLLIQPGSYSHWANFYLSQAFPFREISIVGSELFPIVEIMKDKYSPNTLYSGSKTASDLPILHQRAKENKTFIYVCTDKVCASPVDSIIEAKQLLS